MSNETTQDKMVKAINEILESKIKETKNLTLVNQRGYLTGWLARLASQDWLIRQEIEARLDKVREGKSGAGSENRTRK